MLFPFLFTDNLCERWVIKVTSALPCALSVVLRGHGWCLLLHPHSAGPAYWLCPFLEWVVGGKDGGRELEMLVCRWADGAEHFSIVHILWGFQGLISSKRFSVWRGNLFVLLIHSLVKLFGQLPGNIPQTRRESKRTRVANLNISKPVLEPCAFNSTVS